MHTTALHTWYLLQWVLVCSNEAQLNHRLIVDEIRLCHQEWLWSYYYPGVHIPLNHLTGPEFRVLSWLTGLSLTSSSCTVLLLTSSQNAACGWSLLWIVTKCEVKRGKGKHLFTVKMKIQSLFLCMASHFFLHHLNIILVFPERWIQWFCSGSDWTKRLQINKAMSSQSNWNWFLFGVF